MRIGLLGGTFDPPHLGHLVVAACVRDACDLDEVRFLVAGDPWQKDDELPAATRVELVRAAIEDEPHLGIELVEVERDGPTYTAETLRLLRERDPDVAWHFIAGADTIAGMPTWDDARDLPELATIVGVDRPGTERPTGWPAEHVTWVDVPVIGVSSTTIRERVRAGLPVRHLVPRAVLARMDALRLYRSRDA